MLAATLGATRLLAPRCFDHLRSIVRVSLTEARTSPTQLATGILLPLVALFAAALAATLAQTRGSLRSTGPSRRLAPDGVGSLGALLLLSAGLAIAASLACSDDPIPDALRSLDALLVALTVVGVIDLGVRVARWRTASRPTPSQSREQEREDSGDPLLRSHRRAMQRSELSGAGIESSWVLLRGHREVIALDGPDGRVVLHAEGALCDEVLASAEAKGWVVEYRPDLVRALRPKIRASSLFLPR